MLIFEAFDWIGKAWRQNFAASQEMIAKLAKDLPDQIQFNNLRGRIDADATVFCLLAYTVSAWPEIDKHCARLAEFGQVVAQYVMGRVHEHGLGRPKDLTKAHNWYRKAALEGLPRAQNALGRMVMRGMGVKASAARGANWVRRAAEQGYAPAQFNLGYMHEKGFGVLAHPVAAANWYRRAAERGHARAQFNLAARYMAADGVPHDAVEGYKWLLLAGISQGVDHSAKGDVKEKSARARWLFEARMTPAQLEKAKRRAKAFRPKSTP